MSAVPAPGGLVVEQLQPLRTHALFAEFTGVAGGQPVRVAVTNPGLFTDETHEAAFDAFLRTLPSLALEGAAHTLAVQPNPRGSWAVLWAAPTGPSLAELVARRGPLPPDDAISLTLSLAETLAAAHAKGLVHGDVTPDWVDTVGAPMEMRVSLAGFGLGQLRARLEGRTPRPSDDVTGLAAVLHFMLTGAPPHAGPLSLPAGADHLRGFLSRALGLDLSLRFRSMRELIETLTEANATRVSPGTVLPAAAKRATITQRSLGPWELVKLLGEGAMGQVFLARHTLLGRQAAIKVLRPEQYQRQDLVQRFFQEARSVNQINHEHIVEISDFGHEADADGKPTAVYFVMELLEGETLTARIAKGALPVKTVLHVARQLVSALAAAHRLGVVHRDVKSDNIFLVKRGSDPDYVKVLDFGVAKLTQVTPDAPTVSTMDGAIIGTPTSMSPEQASGQPVDRRADVYAVGVILYQLLSGRLPIDADNFGKLMAQLLTRQPDPLPALTPGGEPIPPWLSALVLRCLAKSPVDRPQSMEELTGLLVEQHAVEPAVAPSRGPMRLVLATAVVALLGVAAFFALRPAEVVVTEAPVDAGSVVAVVAPPVDPTPVPVAADEDAGLAPDAEDAGADDAGIDEVDAGPSQPMTPARPVALTPALFDQTFKRSGTQKRIADCMLRFQTELPADKAELRVKLKVEKTGRISSSELAEASIPAGRLRNCIEQTFLRMQLPRLTAARTFSVPVTINHGR